MVGEGDVSVGGDGHPPVAVVHAAHVGLVEGDRGARGALVGMRVSGLRDELRLAHHGAAVGGEEGGAAGEGVFGTVGNGEKVRRVRVLHRQNIHTLV